MQTLEDKGFKILDFADIQPQIEHLHRFGWDCGKYVGFANFEKHYNMLKGSCTDWTGYPQCFTKDQLIHTDKGVKKISEIKAGEKVLSYNHKEKINEYRAVLADLKHETKQKIYKIKMKDGTTIKVTEDHLFFTGDRYVKIKEILLSLKKK